MKLRTWLLIPIICSPFFWGSTAIAKNGVAIPLPDKRVAVLSEGDLESASVAPILSLFSRMTLFWTLLLAECFLVMVRYSKIMENLG